MTSVLLVNEEPVFGGVNAVVRDLWRHLPGEQLSTRLLVPSKSGAAVDKFLEEWFSDDLARVIVSELRGSGRYLRRLATAVNFFRSIPEEVVNLHSNTIDGVSPPPLWGARLAGKRVVLTVQHLEPEQIRSSFRRRWIKFALSATHAITCSTPLMEDRLRRLHRAATIYVVPNGVSPPTTSYDRAAMRAKFGVPSEAFVVGHLSRLIAGKGLPRVIEAVGRLSSDVPNIYLLAAGADDVDGKFLRELIMSKLPDRANLLGYVEDHHEVLAACDVFAVPSGWEGFGLVYIEAAMHELPRIGTRLGGVPYVIDDGEDGFLLEFDDIDALTARIRLLVDDCPLRERMGAKARDRALSEFTAQLMAKRYAGIIRSVF